MSLNEVKKQQITGFYADVDIPETDYGEDTSDIESTIDEIQGVSPSYKEDRNRTIYEIHTVLDIEGFEDPWELNGEPTGLKLPYIITIDENSETVLAIRRNYIEQDPLKNKINYFVQV